MVHLGKLAKKCPDIDINEHEIQKFRLIFEELIVLCNSDKEFSDGITEILLKIGKQIHSLFIISLKFPAVIKKALKTLKALLNLINTFRKSTEKTKTDERNKLSANNDGKS